jgi:hypothetical protein
MADITPEEIKNTADALWAVLRKQNPEADLQALAACVVMVLGATRPEGRATKTRKTGSKEQRSTERG